MKMRTGTVVSAVIHISIILAVLLVGKLFIAKRDVKLPVTDVELIDDALEPAQSIEGEGSIEPVEDMIVGQQPLSRPNRVIEEAVERRKVEDKRLAEAQVAEDARVTAEEEAAAKAAQVAEDARITAEEEAAAKAAQIAEDARIATEKETAAKAAQIAEDARITAEKEAAAKAAQIAEDARITAEEEAAAKAAQVAEDARITAEEEAAAKAAIAEKTAIEEALKIAMQEDGGVAGSATEQTKGLSSIEQRGLINQIKECWSMPEGVRDAQKWIVTLQVKFTQAGQLQQEPTVLEPNGVLSEGHQQAFMAAKRALIKCQPFDLPVDRYEGWRNIEITFNPKELVRQ